MSVGRNSGPLVVLIKTDWRVRACVVRVCIMSVSQWVKSQNFTFSHQFWRGGFFESVTFFVRTDADALYSTRSGQWILKTAFRGGRRILCNTAISEVSAERILSARIRMPHQSPVICQGHCRSQFAGLAVILFARSQTYKYSGIVEVGSQSLHKYNT